jgi:hypothetical protein
MLGVVPLAFHAGRAMGFNRRKMDDERADARKRRVS